MGDWENRFPDGIWITVVGSGLEPVYLQPNKEGIVYFAVKKGQTLHMKHRWTRPVKG
jgi:hypothetical protein